MKTIISSEELDKSAMEVLNQKFNQDVNDNEVRFVKDIKKTNIMSKFKTIYNNMINIVFNVLNTCLYIVRAIVVYQLEAFDKILKRLRELLSL